jgi:hypothetical protein
MSYRLNNTTKIAPSRPHIPCAQCQESLFMPEWSEYVDERRVRHLWQCDACGYAFETIVCYKAEVEVEAA